MPLKRFDGMGYMHHSKYLGIILIDKSIIKPLDNVGNDYKKQNMKATITEKNPYSCPT